MQQEQKENLFFGESLIGVMNKFVLFTFVSIFSAFFICCSFDNNLRAEDSKVNAKTIESIDNKVANTNKYRTIDKERDTKKVNETNKVSKKIESENHQKVMNCQDSSSYKLDVVSDPDRDSEDFATEPKVLNVSANNKVIVSIKIPTDSDAMGFSLRSTKKTKNGFDVAISYGSRNYYRKQFNFVCKKNNFYLSKILVVSFDKKDSESKNSPQKKEIKINPLKSIKTFSIYDYLSN